MFRDRVVSMEQTLERGEKNLEFLKRLCKEVFPEFEYREHALDHERDLFVMKLEAPDGRRKSVGWTRMVLFDPERLPALLEDPASPIESRLKDFLRERASRPEIVVTFRHLEDGWVDTPEPRREKRRRRGRGDRGRQPEKREGRQRIPGGRPPQPPQQPPPQARPAAGPPSRPPAVAGPARPPAGESSAGAPAREGRRRRRRFRHRRGRGGSGGPAGPAPPSGQP
jgi:hypothetical protein